MKILGIETSCDETSLALVEKTAHGFAVRRYVVSSQALTHARYGGVVPEVAARMHCETLPVLLEKEIGRRGVRETDLIAVTAGPGLITSLMVGVQAAKTLSAVTGIPLVGVNHLEGHLYSPWITNPDLATRGGELFPALVLIVSGGHTELVLMKAYGKYRLLGETLDDAAGEAFDKVAKILDLGYPGGPVISDMARKGNPSAFDFPRPLRDSKNYAMSFSGLKTAVLYTLQKKGTVRKGEVPDIAASFQAAVVDILMTRVARALIEFKPRSLLLAGGVSANPLLRSSFKEAGGTFGIPVFLPALEYTGDNAAMIAVAGYYRRREASRTLWKTLRFEPQLTYIS